jgi:hypothetical protein
MPTPGGPGAPSEDVSPVEDVLDRLHRAKDKAYGDAWCRRGELLGIFANIARKYDRLEVALVEEAPATVEALPDTLADLAVYAGKYLTWLAAYEPDAFNTGSPGPTAAECSADMGPDALVAVLRALPRPVDDGFEAWPAAWDGARAAFHELDEAFMRQAAGAGRPAAVDRVRCAWGLTSGAVAMLRELVTQDPAALRALDAGR